MLSRKLSTPGMMSAAAGIDRGRVGERLQAALAGLQELHHLKEKQGDMVTRALRMDRDDPVSAVQTGTVGPETGTEEQRLEATLAALKQQLVGDQTLLDLNLLFKGFRFKMPCSLHPCRKTNY